MAVIKNLLVRAGADFSALRKEMEKAQKNVNAFKKNINRSMAMVGSTLAGMGVGLGLGAAIQEAMNFETHMQQVNSLMGSSADEFNNWAKTTGKAMGYSRQEAVKYGATFGNLFTIFTTSAEENANATMKFMEAQAVIASKTRRTMDDVGERLRSGMLGNTEAIEDLGVNVQVNAIKMTQAFQQMADGKSWEQLNEKQKQTIRYHAILEQATKKYGTELADNTGTRLMTFTAALNNVKLALGQAFLPILNVVLPSLTAFANGLAKVLGYVSQFMRALFPKGDIKQGTRLYNYEAAAISATGDAAEEAAKKKKKAAKANRGVAGFDEINQLSEAAGASADDVGGGGGGVTTPGPIVDETQNDGALSKISKKIKDFADKFKATLAPIGNFFKLVWNEISTYFGSKVKQLIEFWNQYGAQFMQALRNIWKFLKPIVSWIVEFIWDAIKGLIDGVIRVFEGLIKFIAGAFTGDWKTAFSGIKDIIFGAFQAIWNFLSLTFFKSIGTGIVNLIKNFGKGFTEIITKVKTPFNKIGSWFKGVGDDVWSSFTSPFKKASEWFQTNVVAKITSSLTSIKNGFKDGIGSGLKAVLNQFIGLFNGAIGKFNSFKSQIPVVGDKIPNIPKIPALAKGGITNGPTLALIGDNPGGQEVVSPLDKLEDLIAGAVGNAVMLANQYGNRSNSSGDILLNIDGRTFARIVKPFLENENQRIGNNIKLNPI